MKKIQVQTFIGENSKLINGKIEKGKIYWLVVGEGEETTTINVGEKTYEAVTKLLTKKL